jgi:hypothetical protein
MRHVQIIFGRLFFFHPLEYNSELVLLQLIGLISVIHFIFCLLTYLRDLVTSRLCGADPQQLSSTSGDNNL